MPTRRLVRAHAAAKKALAECSDAADASKHESGPAYNALETNADTVGKAYDITDSTDDGDDDELNESLREGRRNSGTLKLRCFSHGKGGY